MEYPRDRQQGSPTPNDKLEVCDKGQHAQWSPHGGPDKVRVCSTHNARFREATPAEYKAGRKALIISEF